MRFYLRILAMCLCLASFAYAGDQHRPNIFAFNGEWVYFMPSMEQNYFVSDFESNLDFNKIGDRIPVEYDFCSGFRVEGIFYGCSGDGGVRWLRLHTSDRRTVSGEFLVLTEIVVGDIIDGAVQNTVDLELDAVDLYFRQSFCLTPWFDLAASAGLHYIRLEHKDVTAVEVDSLPQADIKHKGVTHGVGPAVGISSAYRFCDCIPLALRASGTFALLAGHMDASVVTVDQGDVELSLNNKSEWRVIPYTNIRLGFEYSSCICSCNLRLEIGYEFLNYAKSLASIYVIAIDDRPTFDLYSDLGYHGPYVSLGFDF